MPGKLTGTNGFIDSTRNLLWPVKSDFFLTEQYEMWAESKTTNVWAWIVSGLFLVFVFTGIIIKRKSRRGGWTTNHNLTKLNKPKTILHNPLTSASVSDV